MAMNLRGEGLGVCKIDTAAAQSNQTKVSIRGAHNAGVRININTAPAREDAIKPIGRGARLEIGHLEPMGNGKPIVEIHDPSESPGLRRATLARSEHPIRSLDNLPKTEIVIDAEPIDPPPEIPKVEIVIEASSPDAA